MAAAQPSASTNATARARPISTLTSRGKFAPASAIPETTITRITLTGPWPRESSFWRNGLYRPARRISRRVSHRETARTMIAGTMIVTAPMIHPGIQDKIESIQVIRACTVVELDAFFADDHLDCPRRPKSERSHERRGEDRHYRASRTPASGDGRPVGRPREHRFRQLQQARRRCRRRSAAGLARGGGHSLRDLSERNFWRLHGGACSRHRRRQPADRADGSPRHRIPRRHRGPAAVPDRRRPGLWAGRRRHESGPCHEHLRARSVATLRRAVSADRSLHLGRGDRLALLAPGHRGRGQGRARRLQLRARPAERQSRVAAQRGGLYRIGGDWPRRPFRRRACARGQRHRGARRARSSGCTG